MKTVLNQSCPEIPFFGAHYPDARCIDGYLWDLDSDENGGLTQRGEIPCPFCNTEKFIEWDPFSWVGLILEDMEEDGDTITSSLETLAKVKAKDIYIEWIEKMREQYG